MGARFCIGLILALSAYTYADSNLRISDIGLHGYSGTPCPVRLNVRNPSSQKQSIHLKVAAIDGWGNANSMVSSDVSVDAGEERQVELPILLPEGETKITADAFLGKSFLGHDVYTKSMRNTSLVALMCTSDESCQSAQSQIQFSGSIEEKADKNRKLAFVVMNDPRDHWWTYSAATSVVVAMPMTRFSPAQREALEGFLRMGGRLILAEQEIADNNFLSGYRRTPAVANGEHVGKGTLFRVSAISANTLGDVFAGRNLPSFLDGQLNAWSFISDQRNGLRNRFGTHFKFPRLRWMLIWLGAYIVIIGFVNFAVLRRLHRLEFGWISTCLLALGFAAGFYYSGASQRPKEFRLDNIATFYLDARSPRAAADYELRLSAPERRNVVVSIADPAVYTYSSFITGGQPNSQIWAELNQRTARAAFEYDIQLGPPSEVSLSLLKWSFRDLNLRGLREFSGTVHFVAPNRLRNDTGQYFSEAVYLDDRANALYKLPPIEPRQEIQLDTIPSKPIRTRDVGAIVVLPNLDESGVLLRELATSYLPLANAGGLFAGFSDGPALPVELSAHHEQDTHSLIVVALDQP